MNGMPDTNPNSNGEVISSMDLFPTVSKLAGVPLPTDRVYDGKEATAILLKPGQSGKSLHQCLFFYGGAGSQRNGKYGPTAARCGKYKAHWATGPGLGGCDGCKKISYPDVPLLFDIEVDPSEASAITPQTPLLFNVDCGPHVLDRLTR